MKAFFKEKDFVKIRKTGKFGRVEKPPILIPKDGVPTYNYLVQIYDDVSPQVNLIAGKMNY